MHSGLCENQRHEFSGPSDRSHLIEKARESVAFILVPDFGSSVLKLPGGKQWDSDSAASLEALKKEDLDSGKAAELRTELDGGLSAERIGRGWAGVSMESYGGLMADLEERNMGTAYAVGYDFRQPGQVSEGQVLEGIQKILDGEAKNADRVVLVTHGTGGLLVRSLLKQGKLKEGEAKKGGISGVVHIAQPVLGTPELARRMLKPHPMDGDGLLGGLAQSPEEAQTLLAEVPGAFLLLPPTDEEGQWHIPSSGPEGGLTTKAFQLPSPGLDAETAATFRAGHKQALDFLGPLGTGTFHSKTVSIYMDGVSTEQTPHFDEPLKPSHHPPHHHGEPEEDEYGNPIHHHAGRFTELSSGGHLEIPPEDRPDRWNLRIDRFADGDGLVPAESAMALFPGESHSLEDLKHPEAAKQAIRQIRVRGVEHDDCSHPDVIGAVRRSLGTLLHKPIDQKNSPGNIDFSFLETETFTRKVMEAPVAKAPSILTRADLSHFGLRGARHMPEDLIQRHLRFATIQTLPDIIEVVEAPIVSSLPPIIAPEWLMNYEKLEKDPEGWFFDRCAEYGIGIVDVRGDPDRIQEYDPQTYGYSNLERGAREMGYRNGVRKSPRDLLGITNVVVHITATPKTAGAKGAVGIPVHVVVQGDGTVILSHHFEDYMAGGDGSNAYSVQVEINGDKENIYDPKQIIAARLFMTYFYFWRKKLLAERGIVNAPPTTVGGHGMYVTQKLHDPGALIWKEVGHWGIDNLGYTLDPEIGGRGTPQYLAQNGGKAPHGYYDPNWDPTAEYPSNTVKRALREGKWDRVHPTGIYPYTPLPDKDKWTGSF